MEKVIEHMLDSYEKGRISRRQFVQSLAVVTASLQIGHQPAESIFRGKTLNHVSLFGVSDIVRSRDFYQRLLGLRVRNQDKDRCEFDLGDSFLGLYKEGKAGTIDHFCIGIEGFNVDAVFEKLKKELPSADPTKEYEGKQIYLRDPDNIRFQLCPTEYKK